MSTRYKADESPVTAADLAAEELLRAELALLLRACRSSPRKRSSRGAARYRRHLPAGRSARRHARIHRVERRFHRQYRAGGGRGAEPRNYLRPAVEKLYAGGTFASGEARASAPPARPARRWIGDVGADPLPARSPMPAHRHAAARISIPTPANSSASLDIAESLSCGSALKFGLVAEGRADIYPRLSTVLRMGCRGAMRCARTPPGGSVRRPYGKPLRYGRTEAKYRVPAFIAYGAQG